MIGSHNSFSYLKSSNPIFNLFKRYWKCQELNLDEQYQIGVNMFDIRVFKNHHGDWQLCHGMVNFNMHFDNMNHLCDYIENNYPNAIYRIVIEKGYERVQMPENFAHILLEKYKNLWNIAYRGKGTWNIIANKGKKLGEYLDLNTWESPNIEINASNHWDNNKSFFKNIYNFVFNTNIRENLKEITKNQSYFTNGNIDSRDYVIMSDYVNLLK